MQLASRTLGQSDNRMYTIDYRDFLTKGDTLTSGAITVPSGTVSVPSVCTLLPDNTGFTFFMHAGAVNEDFTATVVATDTNGQIVNDTIEFHVINP